MLTPTEELKIASAYLNAAEESFNQACTCLENVHTHQDSHKTTLTKFQAILKHLHVQFSQLEQQFQAIILPADQNDQQDL